MGLFDKLKQGLTKTWKSLNTDVRDLFKSEGRLVDDAFLDELRAMLFKTDMGYDAVEQIVAQVASDFRARVVTMEDALATIKKKLLELLAQPEAPIKFAESGPTVIMVCGVNGSGKTTTIAKLAQLLRSSGKKVILGAGDTFRAAAVEQLTIWSDRIGVPIVTGAERSSGERRLSCSRGGDQNGCGCGDRRYGWPAANPEEPYGRADENSGGDPQTNPSRAARGIARPRRDNGSERH